MHSLTYSLLFSLAAISTTTPAAEPASNKQALERGRYLLIAGGCNDCHTPGYMQSEGKVPEPAWLTGNSVGFQGPWGTTYPTNLRLHVQKISEAEWLARARKPMRPPMPWFNLRAMTDADLRAMYRYIRELGPTGTPAPAAVAPGVAVTTPYIEFVPKNLPKQAMK
ncbi:MAG: c-type cytochrome [Gammaproteobacteria bacterium]|nr:c-type cytochrome [Gammaproteobacteria bacterium]